MKHVWSSIGGVTVVLVSILVFACDNATPVASDPGLEVDPVD
tara:strand:- start:636 stop:761 length:126 start_codon:yes stop_codon:yes gene_type:complete